MRASGTRMKKIARAFIRGFAGYVCANSHTYFPIASRAMTLIAIWLESSLLLSTVLVGAFVPQMLWVIDFLFECSGGHLTRMTGYMFDADLPLFLRCLSFFHFWLVFLMIYLVWCVGYDKR